MSSSNWWLCFFLRNCRTHVVVLCKQLTYQRDQVRLEFFLHVLRCKWEGKYERSVIDHYVYQWKLTAASSICWSTDEIEIILLLITKPMVFVGTSYYIQHAPSFSLWSSFDCMTMHSCSNKCCLVMLIMGKQGVYQWSIIIKWFFDSFCFVILILFYVTPPPHTEYLYCFTSETVLHYICNIIMLDDKQADQSTLLLTTY